MPDGLIDIYDENNELTGEQKLISQAHDDGSWHRAAHIWIFNSKGEIMLQHRAKGKRLFPDVWDVSSAGHVDAGEEPRDSALRETEEELGLKFKPEDLNFWKTKKISLLDHQIINNEFIYIYFTKFDGSPIDLEIEKKELEEIKFFKPEEIKDGLKNTPLKFVPHGQYWDEIMCKIKNLK